MMISGEGEGGRVGGVEAATLPIIASENNNMYMASISTRGPKGTSLQSMVKLDKMSCVQTHFLKAINQGFLKTCACTCHALQTGWGMLQQKIAKYYRL